MKRTHLESVAAESSPEQRILEIARDHLRRYGPQRLTILAVAAEAGMSHANVYRYFASKKDLIAAVTAAWLKPLELELRLIVEGPDPAYDKLDRALHAIQQTYRNQMEREPALFRLLCRAVEANELVARKHRSRVQSEIQKILEEGVSSGIFRVLDRRRAMALVFDIAHRFIQPVSLALDHDAPRADIDRRMARARLIIQRSLRMTDAQIDE